MKELSQIQELFAGIYNIYVINTDDIVSFNDIIEGVLQGITLKQGTEYIKIPFTQNNAGFETKSFTKKIIYNYKGIELHLPGNDLSQIQDLTEMDGRTFILIFEDRQNRLWVAGYSDNPLRFEDRYTTGKSPADASGRKIIFESDSKLSVNGFSGFDSIEYYDPGAQGDFYITSTQQSVSIRLRGTAGQTVVFKNDGGDTRAVNLLGDTLPAHDVDFTIPVNGNIYCISGAEHVTWFDANTQGLTAIGNMSEFTNLKYLYLNDNNLQSVNTSGCSTLTYFNVGGNNSLSDITFPENNILEIIYLDNCALASIDMSLFYEKAKYLTISMNFGITANWDLSQFKKLQNLNATYTNMTQAQVDQFFVTFLSSWETYSRSIDPDHGTDLSTQYSPAPSTSGLAAIATIESYGITCWYTE